MTQREEREIKRGGGREKEKEGDRESKTKKDRQIDRHRDRQTDRKRKNIPPQLSNMPEPTSTASVRVMPSSQSQP